MQLMNNANKNSKNSKNIQELRRHPFLKRFKIIFYYFDRIPKCF